MKKKYNISVISKACGIKPHTLRAWESRYELFSPTRDSKGIRYYTEEDFEKAISLSVLVEEGHSISSLKDYSLDTLKEMSKDLIRNTNGSSPQKALKNHLKKLFQDVETYDLESLSEELSFCRTSYSVKDFIMDIVLPVLQETGKQVEKGKLTVTQEHILSTIIRDQLSQIQIPAFQQKKNQFALATPEGNMHELSIGIANILTKSYKFQTSYLGAAHPADCLAQALNILKTPHLILGVVSSDAWNYQKQISKYLSDLDYYLNYDVNVILGGGVKLNFPEFKNISEIRSMPNFEEFNQYLSGLL